MVLLFSLTKKLKNFYKFALCDSILIGIQMLVNLFAALVIKKTDTE